MRSYDDHCDSLDARKPCRVCEQPSHTDVCAECVAMQDDTMQAATPSLAPRAVMRRVVEAK